MKLHFRKIFIFLSVVVLLAAGCSQAQDNNQPLPLQNRQPTSTSHRVTPLSQTQTRDNPNGLDFFPNGQKPGGVASAATITVTQMVEGSSFNKFSDVIPAGENAIDLLKLDHKVEVKNYSGIGDFVTSIDGKAPNSKKFWEFFINDKSSNVGASSYILKAGDKIEWKLEAISGSNQ